MLADRLPRTAIVGRGRAGSALLGALLELGVDTKSMAGRSIGEEPVPGFVATADLLILAVADAAIAGTAGALAASLPVASTGIAFHLSGAVDSSLLAPLQLSGYRTASWHPMQTFTGSMSGLSAFQGIVVGMEGEEEALRLGERLAESLGARGVRIPSSGKALYHLAAALAANGLTALLSAAKDSLLAAGVPESEWVRALAPLANRALSAAFEDGPANALTGPVARGDEATIAAHRRALAARFPERLALYDELVREQRRLLRARLP